MAHTFGIECTHGSWYHLHQNREKTDSHGSLMVFFAICLYIVLFINPLPFRISAAALLWLCSRFFHTKTTPREEDWSWLCIVYLAFLGGLKSQIQHHFCQFFILVVQQNKSFICSSNIGVSTEWVVHTKQQALLFVTNFIQFQ